METEKKAEKKAGKAPARASRPWVVLEDGRRVSRTWAAMLAAAKDPWLEIVDMKAVVEGMYR